MSNTSDRRAPGTYRIPFDAMVEVGGALGPSFEAQAINLSEEGMSLRTAYLPEVGQPVMCRFDTGSGAGVVAAGEVTWKDDMGNGGEFGIRFTNLDGQSTVSLQRVLGMAEDGQVAPPTQGRKVRLHIEGLASPMRARIREQLPAGVTAYSDLGFLEMGRPLELEDAGSGNRRPALIDRVEIAVDDGSRIPQLVVSLRYDDAEGRAAADASIHDIQHTPQDPAAGQYDLSYAEESALHEAEGELHHDVSHEREEAEPALAEAKAAGIESEDADGSELKSKFARTAAKVTPAILAWVKRAKTTATLLAARARKRTESEGEVPQRRTTAPAPGGGLHAAGRKVVRGSTSDAHFEGEPPSEGSSRFKITRKKVAVAGSIAVATALVGIAMHKPAPAPQLASAPPAESAAVEPPLAALGNAPTPVAKPVAPPADPLTAAALANAKPGRATPFVNGNVGSHPNVIKIKMDGVIEGIQGAPQPTGFTIVIPNRKTAEPATTLAEKDPRISSVNVSNEAGGAEFSVSFKDGVPPYVVRAHGDTLEMVLAKSSAHGDKTEASAKKKKGKKH